MNRLEFIGQTHQGTLVSIDDIIKYFDHTMAVYDIVGNVEGASVHGITGNIHSSLKIQVESPNLSKLQEVVTYINDTIHNRKDLYGKSFKIYARIDGNIVDLFVCEDFSVN